MHYLACLPETTMKVRGDYIKRGKRENKEDGRLMIVFRDFRRPLRASESNTEQ